MSAADLAKAQKERFDQSVSSIKAAIGHIENEIAKYGYYPGNKGRVTMAEVCKLAGISPSTLKNKRHHTTRQRVKNWLETLRKRAPTARADASAFKRAKDKELLAQVEMIAGNFNRFKIKYDAAIEEAETLRRRVRELESDNEALTIQLNAARRNTQVRGAGSQLESGDNVLNFPDISSRRPPET